MLSWVNTEAESLRELFLSQYSLHKWHFNLPLITQFLFPSFIYDITNSMFHNKCFLILAISVTVSQINNLDTKY